MKFEIQSIATVYNKRKKATDDFWGNTISEIRLHDHIPEESLDGIETFSHTEILYVFHKASGPVVWGSVHPRGNTNWPKAGILFCGKKTGPILLALPFVKL